MDKTAEKTKHEKAPPVPSPEVIQAAYECHTLAQYLWSQLATAHPWLVQGPQTPPPPTGGFGMPGPQPWTPVQP